MITSFRDVDIWPVMKNVTNILFTYVDKCLPTLILLLLNNYIISNPEECLPMLTVGYSIDNLVFSFYVDLIFHFS